MDIEMEEAAELKQKNSIIQHTNNTWYNYDGVKHIEVYVLHHFYGGDN